MASRIYSASDADAPLHKSHEWRHVGANGDLVDRALSDDKPAITPQRPDETFQHLLREQSEQSYRQGEAAGRNAAQAELNEKMKALGRAIENAASHKSRLRQEAEREVVGLALAVARRILRRQFQVDEEAILGLVKAAFENANLREITEVRVNPQFAGIVQNHLQSIGAPVSIRLTADGSLELGGVIVETGRGCLDASAERQLDEISRGFADAVSLTRRNS